MTAPGDLFAPPPCWRKPGPREHACRVCGSAAPCAEGTAHYCVRHAPQSYWPKGRGGDR